MSKKIYKTAAEKQKAYRIRHGQRRKVPVTMRRGEKLGAQETDLRAKKEGESWEEYHTYIEKTITKARLKQAKATTTRDEEVKPGANRKGKEPGFDKEWREIDEDYYEIKEAHEKMLKALEERSKIKQK